MDDNKKNKWKRRFLNFIVGFLVLFIIAVIWASSQYHRGFDLSEGLMDVLSGIVIATICTAGIGGFVIVVVSSFAGSIILYIIRRYNPRNFKINKKPEDTFLNRGESTSSALKDYIIKARQSGMSAKEIEENLLRVGWSEEVIKQAVNELNGLR